MNVLSAITGATLAVLSAGHSVAQGKQTGEAHRLMNGKPDYHQFEGEIVEVIDADTLRIRIHLLPGLTYQVAVRAQGVDAPEIRRYECDWERELGLRAKRKVENAFEIGEWVYVESLGPDSFSGRVVGDIKQWYGNQRWRTLTDFLLDHPDGFAVPYVRETPFNWCANVE